MRSSYRDRENGFFSRIFFLPLCSDYQITESLKKKCRDMWRPISKKKQITD